MKLLGMELLASGVTTAGGITRYEIARYRITRYRVARYGVARYKLARYGIARHKLARYGLAKNVVKVELGLAIYYVI